MWANHRSTIRTIAGRERLRTCLQSESSARWILPVHVHRLTRDKLRPSLSLEREEERDSRDDVVTLSSRSDQYQISPHNIRA